jgi:hypothetical protein
MKHKEKTNHFCLIDLISLRILSPHPEHKKQILQLKRGSYSFRPNQNLRLIALQARHSILKAGKYRITLVAA